MKHTVEYALSRAEVWRTYWRAWAQPAGLWRVHFGIAILAAVATSFLNRDAYAALPRLATTAVAATLISVVLLALWPQLRFKKAVRLLTIHPSGFTTTIGTLSGARSWKEVSGIDDTGEDILIIGTNRHAMIVPRRAFGDDSERRKFLEAARSWHAAAN